MKCNVDASLDQAKDLKKYQLEDIKKENGVEYKNGSESVNEKAKRIGYVERLFRDWLGHVKGDLFFDTVPNMINTLQTELIAIRLRLEQFLQQFLELDFDGKKGIYKINYRMR